MPNGQPSQLANLKPFPPGVSGNPKGRPAAGASVRNWINELQDCSRAEIETVLNDEATPASKRAAARVWIDAMSRERNASDSPIAGPELDRICDRTDGKPEKTVNVNVNTQHTVTLGSCLEQLIAANVPRDRWPPVLRDYADAN